MRNFSWSLGSFSPSPTFVSFTSSTVFSSGSSRVLSATTAVEECERKGIKDRQSLSQKGKLGQIEQNNFYFTNRTQRAQSTATPQTLSLYRVCRIKLPVQYLFKHVRLIMSPQISTDSPQLLFSC